MVMLMGGREWIIHSTCVILHPQAVLAVPHSRSKIHYFNLFLFSSCILQQSDRHQRKRASHPQTGHWICGPSPPSGYNGTLWVWKINIAGHIGWSISLFCHLGRWNSSQRSQKSTLLWPCCLRHSRWRWVGVIAAWKQNAAHSDFLFHRLFLTFFTSLIPVLICFFILFYFIASFLLTFFPSPFTHIPVLIGTLTVFETLMFAAKLRLPTSMTQQNKESIVNVVITELGLESVRNTYIGNFFIRGLSGGQRRRVAIGCELVTSPTLLFLDEPTSGLDSAAAFHVMSSVRRLATGCRTILAGKQQNFICVAVSRAVSNEVPKTKKESVSFMSVTLT